MAIRHATPADLPEIVAIYNASIPGRMATADLAPVSVADRRQWFADFDPARRPIFVACDPDDRPVAWLSLRSFYGRPAYDETVEVGLYTAPAAQRSGYGRALLAHAMTQAPSLRITTLLAFTFAHNAPSLALFRNAGFADWGFLPGVAKLDGVRRDVVILGRAL
ncbi:MAG TPA: GNAT family N-acetyltransferase [Casimicrobiaceae bacterium]|nr:GNAT family N-acetyltransferase [Casimicrobiaceae bacterium]